MKKILAATLFLLTVFTANSQEKNFIDYPYIEVSGAADTMVTPDEIYIKILISEKDSKDKISIEEMEQKLANGLTALGIDIEKDLTASDLTSNFKYYLLKSKDVIKTKTYELKVADAAMAGKVYLKLEEIGISNAYIEKVDYSDLDNLKNLMRTKAIEDAKKRAISLTRPLGQGVGTAIHIVDSEARTGQQLQGRAMGYAVRGVSSISNKQDVSKIEFEKIKVEATITAKFTLKGDL